MHNQTAHTKPRRCPEPLTGVVDNVYLGPEPVCANIDGGLLLTLVIRNSEPPFHITWGIASHHHWRHVQ